MLKGNLEKVTQHGKRADSIVKNMLLHSRQGSGEHRPSDINAIVEESLNLAYHGARAEKKGFNITLEKSLRSSRRARSTVYAQEITRVLINLISNGFYATAKRSASSNGVAYEPVLAATTKNLGDSVEIRIRDNGTGIPAGGEGKMFNPFFTTKPAGEGTGLGLSLSHDIIVKQHAGTIDVESEPGSYTEFRIVLPRGPHRSEIGGRRVSLLILVVDDEPDVEVLFRQQFRRDLRDGRFVMDFAHVRRARRWTSSALAANASLILILSDINMPGMSGLELLPKARAARPDVPVIMITAYGDADTKRKALESGAEALLTKPIDFAVLRDEIEADLGWRRERTHPRRR